jgi:hypothetical protein
MADPVEVDEQLSHPLAGHLHPVQVQPPTAIMRTTAVQKIAFASRALPGQGGSLRPFEIRRRTE